MICVNTKNAFAHHLFSCPRPTRASHGLGASKQCYLVPFAFWWPASDRPGRLSAN